jgi:hypothetical protein
MSYAVFMDYEYEGQRNTIVLGGSQCETSAEAGDFLASMKEGDALSYEPCYMWEVDEDMLPWGYAYQTYYVAKYDKVQPMIGVK